MKLLLDCPGMGMKVNPFVQAANIMRTKERNRKKLYADFNAHLVLIGLLVSPKPENN